MTRTQFDLLAAFARHPGRVLTHRALVAEVWGDPDAADPSNLRVFISALRRLIEPDPGHPERIETVAGVGYRFLPGRRRVVRSAGIVLAGGRSLRMGSSKAWLDWHGTPLLARVVGLVARAVDGPIVASLSAAGQQLPALPGGTRVVEDDREALGPLQGIATGLAALADLRRRRVRLVDGCRVAAPGVHPSRAGRVRPGCRDRGPPRPRPSPAARGRLPGCARAADRRAPGTGAGEAGPALRRSRTRFVDDAWLLADPRIAAVDPGLASLENLNDPEAYRAALALPPLELDGA